MDLYSISNINRSTHIITNSFTTHIGGLGIVMATSLPAPHICGMGITMWGIPMRRIPMASPIRWAPIEYQGPMGIILGVKFAWDLNERKGGGQ